MIPVVVARIEGILPLCPALVWQSYPCIIASPYS
jgi:hypothetical protein